MSRDPKVYLEDIEQAIAKIGRYTARLSFSDFEQNELVVDGVIRNLEVIGEAVRRLPPPLIAAHPGIQWRKIAALRNILAHEYFGVDLEIVWDVVQNKLPSLKEEVNQMLSE